MHVWRRFVGSLLALLVVVLAPPGLAAQENTLAEGKKLFTQQGCYGCHMIEKYGTPIATDLSHIGAKYDRAYLTRWLKDPLGSEADRAHAEDHAHRRRGASPGNLSRLATLSRRGIRDELAAQGPSCNGFLTGFTAGPCQSD
jgi:hypothetical protein